MVLKTGERLTISRKILNTLEKFRVNPFGLSIQCFPMWAGGSYFALSQNNSNEFGDIDIFIRVKNNSVRDKMIDDSIIEHLKELWGFDNFVRNCFNVYFNSSGYQEIPDFYVLGHFFHDFGGDIPKQKVQIIVSNKTHDKTLDRFDIVNLKVGTNCERNIDRSTHKLNELCSSNIVIDGLQCRGNTVDRAKKYIKRIKYRNKDAQCYTYIGDYEYIPIVFEMPSQMIADTNRGLGFVRYVMRNFKFNEDTVDGLVNYDVKNKVYKIRFLEVDRLKDEFVNGKRFAQPNLCGDRIITTVNSANYKLSYGDSNDTIITYLPEIKNKATQLSRCPVHDKEFVKIVIGGEFNGLRGQMVCPGCLPQILRSKKPVKRLSFTKIAAAIFSTGGIILTLLKISGIL